MGWQAGSEAERLKAIGVSFAASSAVCARLASDPAWLGGGVLAWAATMPLGTDDRAPLEELPTPDAGRFLSSQRPEQAGAPDRAAHAEGFRQLEFSGVLGEPQLGVVTLTRQLGLVLERCLARAEVI